MPIFRAEMLVGRTQDQKRRLTPELTSAFVKVAGGNPQTVHVVMTDGDKGNWGSGGEFCFDKFPD